MFLKREHSETERHTGRMPWDDEGRDQGEVLPSLGMPEIGRHCRKPAERHGIDSPLWP